VAGDGHEIELFLRLAAERILDLKNDARIKYVSLFKDYGSHAGQEFDHPTSQLTATMFVPRRVLYELRAGREYFLSKERCVFCDILNQEERQAVRVVEASGDYVAFVLTRRGFLTKPGFSRVPMRPGSSVRR